MYYVQYYLQFILIFVLCLILLTVTHENDTGSFEGYSNVDLGNPIFADIDLASMNSTHGHPVHHWNIESYHDYENTESQGNESTVLTATELLRSSRNALKDKIEIVNSENRGKSLIRSDNAVMESWNGEIIEGKWAIRRTPCSVTCGQGKMKYL